MAADNQKTEFHLTPGGWVKGTSTFFGRPSGITVPTPEDAVETWVRQIYQRSEWSKEELSLYQSWRNPEAPDQLVRELHDRFGQDPQS